MDYASFWGLTAPQLVLQDVDLTTFGKAVSLLNNAQDSHKLTSFRMELDELSNFLTNKLHFDYKDAEIRKKARQLELSKLHYETGKEVRKSKLIPKEEIPAFEKMINSFPKELSSYIMIDGNRVDISESALKIIKCFLGKQYIIDDYRKNIKVNASQEILVFNRKLEDVIYGKEQSIKYRYMQKISSSKDNEAILTATIASIQKDISILKKLIDYNEQDNTNTSQEPLGVSSKQLSMLPVKYDNFIKKLKKLGILKRVTYSDLNILLEIYSWAQDLTLEFYNSEFSLDLSEEEMEKVFLELDKLGLVGLNLYATDFLLNSLMSILLVKPFNFSIPSESGLALVITEIDRALDSRIKFGEGI